jgi:branched-chain amino acid transport system ATP-binding protein
MSEATADGIVTDALPSDEQLAEAAGAIPDVAPSGRPLLEVRDLHAGYGPIEVLHGLDFTVGEGEMVVILGANGAGKTTTMRAISGVIPRRGTILLGGTDISQHSADEVVGAGVAQVPQGRGTFAELSVEDNLRVGAYLRKDDLRPDVNRWFEVFPRLGDRRTQKAGSLSGGEQQMLAIARAVMSNPRLLLCDEPSQGLAPIIVQELFRILQRLNEEDGTAVLLVEQNANLAMDVANRAYVLETGSFVASGDASTLRDDETIRKAYLGY